jgi:DNA polymerase-4
VRKSLGTETTFQKDIGDFDTLIDTLKQLAHKAWHQLDQKHLSARTITIKVKFDNFEQITRRKTLEHATIQRENMPLMVKELLAKTEANQRKVRLLGVCLSGLSAIRSDGIRQLDLFE